MSQLAMVATETSFVAWTSSMGKKNKINVVYTQTGEEDDGTPAQYSPDYQELSQIKPPLDQQFTVQAVIICPTERGLHLLDSPGNLPFYQQSNHLNKIYCSYS